MAGFRPSVRRARYRLAECKLPAQILALLVLVALGLRFAVSSESSTARIVDKTPTFDGINSLTDVDGPNGIGSVGGSGRGSSSIIHDSNLDSTPAKPHKPNVVPNLNVYIRPPTFSASLKDPSIRWDRYAYVLQAGTPEYLCNALMIFAELHELGSRAARVLQYPNDWELNGVDEHGEQLDLAAITRLLQLAIRAYGVQLELVDFLHKDERQASWTDSFNKLRALNMTRFDRVVALDSDSIVLRPLDDLFFMQPAPVALPYVYWGEPRGWQLSSNLMVLTPSTLDFLAVANVFESAAASDYDMDMLASIYSDRLERLPQRPYNLLTGEFRRASHAHYLGTDEPWHATKVLGEARFVHFADWPLPKPWVRAREDAIVKAMPQCAASGWLGGNDCTDRQVWLGFYTNFAARRTKVCGAGFEPRLRDMPNQAIYRHGQWYNVDEVT